MFCVASHVLHNHHLGAAGRNVNLLTTAGDGQARDKACAAVLLVDASGVAGVGMVVRVDKERPLKIDRKEFSETFVVDS